MPLLFKKAFFILHPYFNQIKFLMSHAKYLLITLLAYMLFLSCKENGATTTTEIIAEEQVPDKGQMFLRDDLAFVRLLQVEVPIGEADQLLLSNDFVLMNADGGHYNYRKKNETWDMTIEITVPGETSTIQMNEIKIAGVNNSVTLDGIFDTLSILFEESFGEPVHTGEGQKPGEKYVEYIKYDETGGISRNLRIENGQVEVFIQAFSF
jgi:hypothetical protein